MPKAVDHEEMRATLGAAVVPLFASRGYAAVTMQELATAAGVRKSTAYHYFPTKAAWFGAACSHVLAEEVRAMQAVAGGGAPVERMRRILAADQATQAETRVRTLVLVEAVRGGAGPAVAPAVARYAEQVSALLGVPIHVTHELLAALTGAALLQEIDPNIDLRGLLERLVEGAWASR